MNLPYTYALLLAASEQNGSLDLAGVEAEQEVRQMTATGLVEAKFHDGHGRSLTSILRVLPAGHTFLRTFKDLPVSTPVPKVQQTASQLGYCGQVEAEVRRMRNACH